MKQRLFSPVLRQLAVLVGEWRMEASVSGELMARGRAVFEWLEGGAFLVQHADAEPPPPTARPEWVANSPFPLVTIMGLDDPSGKFCCVYADARGVRRVYRMSLSDDGWKIWGRQAPSFFSNSRRPSATTAIPSRAAGNDRAMARIGSATSTSPIRE